MKRQLCERHAKAETILFGAVNCYVCELERHANERRDMIECTDDMTLRNMHTLAHEGCRFFYLRPSQEAET